MRLLERRRRGRKLVRELGGFDEQLFQLADWDLWIRLALAGRAAAVAGDPRRLRDARGEHAPDRSARRLPRVRVPRAEARARRSGRTASSSTGRSSPAGSPAGIAAPGSREARGTVTYATGACRHRDAGALVRAARGVLPERAIELGSGRAALERRSELQKLAVPEPDWLAPLPAREQREARAGRAKRPDSEPEGRADARPGEADRCPAARPRERREPAVNPAARAASATRASARTVGVADHLERPAGDLRELVPPVDAAPAARRLVVEGRAAGRGAACGSRPSSRPRRAARTCRRGIPAPADRARRPRRAELRRRRARPACSSSIASVRARGALDARRPSPPGTRAREARRRRWSKARWSRSHQNANGRSSEAPERKKVACASRVARIGSATLEWQARSSSNVIATGNRSPRLRRAAAAWSSEACTTR